MINKGAMTFLAVEEALSMINNEQQQFDNSSCNVSTNNDNIDNGQELVSQLIS